MSLILNSDPDMSFSLTSSSSFSVKCLYGGSSTTGLSFTYSYATFPLFGCIGWQAYFDPATNTCDYSCPSSKFANSKIFC